MFSDQETYEGRLLLDLLAVIHRDGGHYTAKHGLQKSCEEAMRKSSSRIAFIDEARGQLKRYQEEEGNQE